MLVVNKSTDHDEPHFDLFSATISTSKKMIFIQSVRRARAEKGIARHIDASSVVWLGNKYGLLTKFVRSRWLDIGLVLFLRVYGPRLRLDP